MRDVRGVVRRISNGWPAADKQVVIPRRPRPSTDDMKSFDAVMTHDRFARQLWAYYRGFRDIDYEGLRRWINNFLLRQDQKITGNMEDLVFQFATNQSGLIRWANIGQENALYSNIPG